MDIYKLQETSGPGGVHCCCCNIFGTGKNAPSWHKKYSRLCRHRLAQKDKKYLIKEIWKEELP